MDEIVFLVEEVPSVGFTARAVGPWFFTQSDNIDSPGANVRDAVRCHFGEASRPSQIRFALMSQRGC